MPYVHTFFSVSILTYNYFEGGHTWDIANMSDPYWRVYWHPGQDAGRLVLDNQTYRLSPDVLTLIAPYTPCRSIAGNIPHHFYIHFQAGFPFNLITAQIIQMPMPANLIKTIRPVISRLQKGERLTADMLQSVQISIEVLKLLPHEQTLELDRRVHNTDQFMDENVNRAVSNEELAKQVHMAPNSFARFFREQTGHAPQQYFLRKKVERACMMLQYLDAGIDDIAERLGFCDRYYFTKVFKKQIGLGPAEYRKSALTAI